MATAIVSWNSPPRTQKSCLRCRLAKALIMRYDSTKYPARSGEIPRPAADLDLEGGDDDGDCDGDEERGVGDDCDRGSEGMVTVV